MEPDQILPVAEAARVLGVSVRQVNNMKQQGLLSTAADGFYANEVYALKEIRRRKLSLTDVAMMAQRADISARRTERVMRQLLDTFDFGRSLISLEKDDVLAFHTRVEDELLLLGGLNNVKEVADWACKFNAIGEEYFEVVALYTGSDEPWRPYAELAAKLLKEAPREELRIDNALRLAYECLHKARKDMNIAGFNYARKRYGKVLALRAFPAAKGDVHDSILSFAEFYANH